MRSTLLVLIAFGLAPVVLAQKMDKWEAIDYRSHLITDKQLKGADAALVRGIIFGKHGRIFKEQNIQSYLDSRPWYKKNPKFSNSDLNEDERKNLDIVRGYEAGEHKKVEPGDLRFWDQKFFSQDDLPNNVTDVHIMKAEIEAVHGKTFPGEPQLQAYFDDRYWYKGDPGYSQKSLNNFEVSNLAVLNTLEKKLKGEEVAPGDMDYYMDKPLPARAVSKSSLYDLRLMRNEFYARNGFVFKTPWLQRHFGMMNWYKAGKKTVVLQGVQKANVAVILARENAIHERLSTKALTEDEIGGLFIEDFKKLENEVYARHGKVFKQKWLQSYFESLPWYKPNPKFSAASLTPVEKKNLHLIALASKSAQSAMNAEEG